LPTSPEPRVVRVVDLAGAPLASRDLLALDAAGGLHPARTDATGSLTLPADARALRTPDGAAMVELSEAQDPTALVLPIAAPPDRTLAALLGLALAVRVGWMWIAEPTPLVADEKWYYSSALRLIDQSSKWLYDWSLPVPMTAPPVVPMAYAAITALAGDTERWLRCLNVVLGAALVIPVRGLGLKLGGPRLGWIAGLLAALHPDLVMYSTRLWTETVYGALVWTMLLGLAALEPGRWGRGAQLGLLIGLAALTRESGVGLPLVVAVWALSQGWSGLRARLPVAAVTVTAAVLVAGVWTARLRADPRPEGLLARTSAFNLYIGNVKQDIPYAELGQTEAERASRATALAREAILADMPMWPLHKLQRTLPDFLGQKTLSVYAWTTRQDVPMRVTTRLAPLESPALRGVLGPATAALQAALLSLGAAGLALAARRERTVAPLLLALIVATYAPTLVTFAKPRFAIPCVPAFLLGAAWLADRGRAAWSEAPWPARGVAVAAAAAVLYEATLKWP
jgi:4-amino-4-deoxy-L-arabinose transferase-like glycosyltransferase